MRTDLINGYLSHPSLRGVTFCFWYPFLSCRLRPQILFHAITFQELFGISQPKLVRLPRNKKQIYRLNFRLQMWPSGLTLAMTSTLNLQGQIWPWPLTTHIALTMDSCISWKTWNCCQCFAYSWHHKYILIDMTLRCVVTYGGLLMKNSFRRPCFPPSKQLRNSWMQRLGHFKGKLSCQSPTATRDHLKCWWVLQAL